MTIPDLTQPCRLIRRNDFFIIQVLQDTVVTRFGRGRGSGGRETEHSFNSHAEALKAASEMFTFKTNDGYKLDVDVGAPQQHGNPSDPHTPAGLPLRRSGRKRSAQRSYSPSRSSVKRARKTTSSTRDTTGQSVHPASPAKKKQRRSLRGAPVLDTSSPLGVVDPASEVDGTILSVTGSSSGTPVLYDAMLVLIDIGKRHDKYIVLQLIYDQANDKIVFYERYGRTGTPGQSLKNEYSNSSSTALREFHGKFLQKTGLEWDRREDAPIPRKYRFVKQDFQAKHDAATSDQPIWQYWVVDGVDGKTTGWYNYDHSGNALAEQLYMEFLNNTWLTQRIVQSGTYSYLVDLESMTQHNVVHPNHTVRCIRRVPPNEVPSNEDPTGDFPSTTVHNPNDVQVMSMRATKPNVKVPVSKPSHKVKPAPAAIVPSAKKVPKKTAKSESVELSKEGNEVVVIPVDDACPKASDYHVLGDWDATMNQSNIMGGSNNNKYYRIQLLQHKRQKTFRVWTRWGRVGESRGTQTKLLGPYKELDQAKKAFGKKFKDKTANSWEKRGSFVPFHGKYVLLEIDHSAKKQDQEPLVLKLATEDERVEYLPSKLPKETKELVELLFEKDVYTKAMKEFDIDIRRMPLGKLSTAQIDKGVAVLEEIEEALKNIPLPTSSDLERLSSKFYTTLPHDFGRRRPPIISNMTMLQRLYDMCNILKDMEKATTLMSEADKTRTKEQEKKKVPHPADAQYTSLNADLGLVNPGSEEHKIVSAAYQNTCDSDTSQLLNIWRVERKGEAKRFKTISWPNHMLLWHGSHIGVISAILATGLRIMPHSGGRVGRGIYLASESSMSQGYTTPAKHNKTGCMFLVEAALGEIHEIFEDDSSLQCAPSGYQSVRACGKQSPSGFSRLNLDGESVLVPTEAPVPNPKASHSSFWQDEYVVYNEVQARIRYVITIKK